MNIGKLALGIVVLAVAIWILITQADSTARYVGGAILAVLGISFVIIGLKKKTK